MQVLYLQISYKDNTLFSLNKETVEKYWFITNYF